MKPVPDSLPAFPRRSASSPFRRNRRTGSALLEFALAGSFIFIPLLLGTCTVGLSMVRAIQVVGINRDAGHMFATGVDFSQAGSRNLLLRIAGNMNISDTGGQGVIILSQIDGTGANTAVVSRRFVIGNASLRASSFANPNSVDANGNVANLNDPSSDASTFSGVMPIASGDVFYVAETYFSTSDFDWTGTLTGTGLYSRSVF